ncbi:MAG: hypothetical protein HYR85_16830 [Planctomycetes bacterium]|nr:hypothetical protein [Planctomycetota bacterium]MBI3847194.1 hypothetical protein [Planctomycetota bacterium]
MSNKERIERLAAEAQASAKEKKEKGSKKADKPEKGATPAAAEKTGEPRTRKSARTPRAMKIVWKVFNATGKEVGVFPYPNRAEADAHAATLAAKNGVHHFVEAAKVPME